MVRTGMPILTIILAYKTLTMITPNSPELTTWAAGLATVVVFILTVIEKVKSSRERQRLAGDRELLSESQMWKEKAALMQKASTENLRLYQEEREEHQKTRQFWHAKSNEFQATLSQCQERLATANGRPDMSEILRHIELQGKVLIEVLANIKTLIDRLPSHE